jgi:hypothetical protein
VSRDFLPAAWIRLIGRLLARRAVDCRLARYLGLEAP